MRQKIIFLFLFLIVLSSFAYASDYTYVEDFNTTTYKDSIQDVNWATYGDLNLGIPYRMIDVYSGSSSTNYCYTGSYGNPEATFSSTRYGEIKDFIIKGMNSNNNGAVDVNVQIILYNNTDGIRLASIFRTAVAGEGGFDYDASYPWMFDGNILEKDKSYKLDIDINVNCPTDFSIVMSTDYSAFPQYRVDINGYEPDGYAISKEVDSISSPEEIREVKLTVTDTTPSGTDINYYVSANGGSNWHLMTDGQTIDFDTNDGDDLRWKAELASDTGADTPTITTLTLDYNVGAPVNFTVQGSDSLDPENGVTSVDRNFLNTSQGSATSWEWLVDSVSKSTDENYTHAFTSIGDYNVTLIMTTVSNTYQKDKNVHIYQYPQDVNLNWTPITPSIETDVNFYGAASDDGSIANWFWRDNNAYFADAEDTNKLFTVAGDHNICLTVQDNHDLNKSKCYTISLGGRLKLYFFDENTLEPLVPTVQMAGTSYDVNSEGYLTIGLGGFTTGTYELSAYDANHTIRYFVWDLNQFSTIDANLALLKTTEGKAISFKFYSPDKTDALSNATVYVIRYNESTYSADSNFSSIRTTSSSGETSFFLNTDANYLFHIVKGSSTYNYRGTVVTVNIPKNEKTLAQLTPYNIYVYGLKNESKIGSPDANTFLIFSDTVAYYQFNIDYNSDYYPRNYYLKMQGGDTNYSLQPYLLEIANSILTLFTIYNTYYQTTVPDVLLVAKRAVGGTEQVLVESVVSDISGTANLSLYSLDTYLIEFYYNDELVTSGNLTASLSSYKVNLDLRDINAGTYVSEQTSATITPADYNILAANGTDIDIAVSVATSGEIQSVRLRITQGDTVLSDTNHSTGTITQTISGTNLDGNNFLVAEVTVTTENNVRMFRKKWAIQKASGYDLVNSLQQIPEQIGAEWAMLIASIIIILACAFLTLNQLGNLASTGIVAMILLVFFAVISWIPWLIVGIAGAAAFGSIVVTRGV